MKCLEFNRSWFSLAACAALLIAAGCTTTQPKPAAAPATVADSAITAAELVAVLGAGEAGNLKLETGEPEGNLKLETGEKPAESADKTLTPEEALRIAAEKNPVFAEYAAAREAALAEVKAATAWKNPSLEAGVGRGKTRGSPSESDWEYSLGLIQPIEWPGKREVRKEAAEAGVKVAELDESLFRSTLRADVLRAYWTAAVCAKDLKIGEALLTIATDLRQKAHMQRLAGELSESEMSRFWRETENLEQEKAELRREHELADLLFNKLCGDVLLWEDTVVLGELYPPSYSCINADAAATLAQRKHPAILKLEAEKRRAELVVKQAELAKKPDFTPGLEASRGVDVTSWGARLGMELPFWNRNKAGVAAAKAELHRVEAQLAIKRREVDAEVDAAYIICRATHMRRQYADATAERARLAVIVTEEKFCTGEVGESDLLTAKQDHLLMKRAFLRALQAAILARIQLEQAIGYGEMK